MAVTQYIGARYVPLFADPIQWDSTKEYEPLTIVLYEGNSYTSRQAVPIGVTITNEQFWVETGNYNAQVEAYRQEVRQFDGRISSIEASQEEIDTIIEELQEEFTTLKDDVLNSGMLSIKMFDGSNPDNFTLRLIQTNNANVLIDTGKVEDTNAIFNWLISNNVEHLDAFVISHFHNDHCGNMVNIINSDFVNETTNVFIQMAPTNANDQYSDNYEPFLNMVTNALAAKNYPPAIVPTHGEPITYGTMEVTFFNTIPSWASVYDASWANNGNYTTRTSSLNNYSLITRCECGASCYVDLGDIEGEGQRLNAPYMQPANVVLNPHHFVNKMGYEEFFNKLNPDYWLVANHFYDVDDDERIDVYNYRLSYLYRYNTFNGLNKPIITNISTNVELKILNGDIIKADGHIIDSSYNPENRVLNETYANMLPPSYYNENPYIIYQPEFTIQTAQEIFRQYNQVLYPKAFYIPASSSTSSYASTPFANAMRDLFAPITITSVILFSYDNEGHIEIGYSTVNSPYSRLNLISANGNTPNNVSWVPAKKGKLNHSVIGNFVDNSTMDDSYIRFSNAIELEIDDDGTAQIMAIYRVNGYPETDRNQAGIFEGFKLTGSASGAYLYQAYLTLGGTFRIRKINIADGTYSSDGLKATRFRTIY